MKFPALPSLRHSCVVLSLLLLAIATGAPAERTDAIDATVAEFFRPFQHDLATLAPDGRRVAMTEQLPGKPPAIVIIDVDDRKSQRHVVANGAEHAVQQLQWASPTRVLFTTQSRAVGALDASSGEVTALLRSADLDAYRPEPTLSQRRSNAVVGADMPADASRVGALESEGLARREMSVREALALARVSGDLFGSDSKREAGRSLRPFLLGVKPGAANTVLVELRTDGDLYAYRRGERTDLTVGADVYIAERNSAPPTSSADVPGMEGRRNEYASYSIETAPSPLVVLELDTAKGRTKEIASEQDWRRVWLDQQGRLRLALEQQGRRFRYLYREVDARKWVPLDSIAKTATPLGFAVTAQNLFAPRSVPLGFDVGGRTLFIATNVGHETFVLRALNLGNGQLEEFEVGHDAFDLIEPTALAAGDVLRFDPHTRSLAGVRFAAARRDTRWFDPGMTALQAQLNKQLAPQRCELREWNADRTRFLVEVSAPGNPGGFMVVDATGKMVRCGDRAPWLTDAKRNVTKEFDFLSADGRRLAGLLTLPQAPRLNPPPVLVYFHDGPWYSEPPVFNRGAQALAALGFAVLQLNHRGSSGLGRTHLQGIDGALDRAVLQDVQAMLARGAGGRLPINTGLVATLGNGVGGYLAVRMAQLAPDTFRCAVAINTPGDLAAWNIHSDAAPSLLADLRRQVFGTDRESLRAQSAVAVAATTKAPVLVVHGTANAYVPHSLGKDLYRALKKGSEETAYLELPGEGHGGWSDKTTAKLFAELGRFFNATIYNYQVKVRTPEVVP